MVLRNRGTPSGFSKLAAPLTVPALRRASRKDLANLKTTLESEPRPTSQDREPVACPANKVFGFAENVVHSIAAVILLGSATAVLGAIGYHLVREAADGVEGAVTTALDGLRLVFILLELLAAAPEGAVLVVDERVGAEFTAPAGKVERMMYGFSMLH